MGPWIPKGKIQACKVSRVASHNPALGGAITWDTVVWDTDGCITVPSTNVVIQYPGWYSIVGYVNTSTTSNPGSAHYGYLQIHRNGTELHAARINFSAASGGFHAMTIAVAAYYLVKGNYLTLSWDSNNVTLTPQTGVEQGMNLTVWRYI